MSVLVRNVWALLLVIGCMTAMPSLVVAGVEQQVAASEAEYSERVNINSASADELAASLIGVGAKKAEAIVAWREKHGGFKHIEELQEVKGIGRATLEKNRDHISL